MVPLSAVNGWVQPVEKYSSVSSSRADSWILELQNNINNPQWYYKHLTNADRQIIRQALDWSIDRNHIINDIMGGFANPTFSFIVPSTTYFLENGTKPRQENLTLAKNLLTEVFGYTFDPQNDDTATPYKENEPYFKITQLVPSNNPNRIQWANEIANNWKSIGIKVDSYQKNINYIYSLPVNGPDYNHSGFDVTYLQWLDEGITFYSPSMQISYVNYDMQDIFAFNTSDYFNLINSVFYEQNSIKRDQFIDDYQQWMYDNVPLSFLFGTNAINIKNKDLKGINPLILTNYENWTYNGKTNVTIAVIQGWQLLFFNPGLYVYYDVFYPEIRLMGDSLFKGMFYKTTESSTNSFKQVKTYPYFADWYNKSSDGKTWFLTSNLLLIH